MLTGKLVRLRTQEMSDLDRYLTWINDSEVTRFLAGRYAFSRVQEEEWLARAVQQTRPPEISLAIETIDELRHIGSIGLHKIEAENSRAELEVMIGEKDCWSRGYGTDALTTLLRFAFDEINLHRVYLTVLAENARAIACYRKCGFVEEGRLRKDIYHGGAYTDLLVMGVLADEFRAPPVYAEASA